MADDEENKTQEASFIQAPDTLKGKIGIGGPGAVDLDALARAEEVIAGLSSNYLEWAEEDLKKLDDTIAKLAADKDNGKTHLSRIFQISHDIKGQGGSFGYQMMTILGSQLCHFVEELEDARDNDIKAIKLHVDAMKMVISRRMEGDGGAEGEVLFSGLDKVVAKLK